MMPGAPTPILCYPIGLKRDWGAAANLENTGTFLHQLHLAATLLSGGVSQSTVDKSFEDYRPPLNLIGLPVPTRK